MAEVQTNPPGFFTRLKQHHIYRVAVGYGTAIAVLIQVVARAFPYFGWSAAVPAVIIVLIAGFPVALVLAWLLVKPADSASQTIWQRRHWKLSAVVTVVVIVLVVISGFFGIRFSERHTEFLAATKSNAVPAAINTAAPSPATVIPAKSIAVLPFVNMSGDPKEDYFSDGITEEILNALAQVPGLKVAGRTSAFAFKGKAEDLRKVGEALDVATVLEGSVQKAGDEIRITAQLIDTRSGYHVWSEKYDRKLTNIFAIEDDISSTIAGKLRVQLTGGAGEALVARQAIDPRAHDFYLRGLTRLAARGPGLRDAVAAFQNAVKIAPDYAQAWGALAEAEALYPDYHLDTMQVAYPRALTAAQRALALDPDTASAYVAQGMVYKNQWQWAKADAAFQRAQALAPGDVEMITQYAQFLLATGQIEPALAATERAQRIDPLVAVNGMTRALVLSVLHRDQAAFEQIQRTMAAHPDFATAFGNAIGYAIALHRYADAESYARRVVVLNHLNAQEAAAGIDVIRGLVDPALRARGVQILKTSPFWLRVRDRNPMGYAEWLTRYGERDLALQTLEKVVARGESINTEGIWIPEFDPIRNDPRFKAVLKKMGLPYQPVESAAP